MKDTHSRYLFPYLRSRRERSGGIRIEVSADSMRVGKTTAVRVIAEGLRKRGRRVYESYEDWEHNPHLKKSYSDPGNAFLASQKWFVRRKFMQIRDGAKADVFIQDVPPEMDYCYAATNAEIGRMSSRDFASYRRYFRAIDWSAAPAPDVLVYLTVSNSALVARAEATKREFETVDAEYFLAMKRVNRAWLTGVTREYRVLRVNTDHLDFAHDSRAAKELVDMVAARLT